LGRNHLGDSSRLTRVVTEAGPARFVGEYRTDRMLMLAVGALLMFNACSEGPSEPISPPPLADLWGQYGVTVHQAPSDFAITFAYSRAVNDSGHVAGGNVIPGLTFRQRPAVFAPGVGVRILGFSQGWGTAINNLGHVAGSYDALGGGLLRAFYHNGVMIDTGLPEGWLNSNARGMNDAGRIVGDAPSGFSLFAWVWANGLMDTLNIPGGRSTATAVGINNMGKAVGYGWGHGFPMWAEFRATMWHNGSTIDLGTLGGRSYAQAINDADQVVGWFFDLEGQERAFLHDHGLMRDVGTLGGRQARAWSVSQSGVIAGWSENSSGTVEGTLWQNRGRGYMAYRLSDLIKVGGKNDGWVFSDARSISPNGRFVVAVGSNALLGVSGRVVVLEQSDPR
jgi:probable HAF family extracellular repeat protein